MSSEEIVARIGPLTLEGLTFEQAKELVRLTAVTAVTTPASLVLGGPSSSAVTDAEVSAQISEIAAGFASSPLAHSGKYKTSRKNDKRLLQALRKAGSEGVEAKLFCELLGGVEGRAVSGAAHKFALRVGIDPRTLAPGPRVDNTRRWRLSGGAIAKPSNGAETPPRKMPHRDAITAVLTARDALRAGDIFHAVRAFRPDAIKSSIVSEIRRMTKDGLIVQRGDGSRSRGKLYGLKGGDEPTSTH